MVFAARGSLAWRRVDAELAELSFDSLVDGDLELGRRPSGDDSVRLVSFDGPDLTVEVEVAGSATAGGSSANWCRHRSPSSSCGSPSQPDRSGVEARADDLGRFSLELLGGGPASLRCSLPSGKTIETGWVVI